MLMWRLRRRRKVTINFARYRDIRNYRHGKWHIKCGLSIRGEFTAWAFRKPHTGEGPLEDLVWFESGKTRKEAVNKLRKELDEIQFKLTPPETLTARNREAIQKVAEAADHLHRQMVNTGQQITWFAESFSDMPLYAKCTYCGQGQPDNWDGGGCYYCGGPIDLEFLNRGLESAGPETKLPEPLHNDGRCYR